MKRMLGMLGVLLLSVSAGYGAIEHDPDYTLLWNGFNDLYARDSFVVACGNDGLVVLLFDPATQLYHPVTTQFLEARPVRQKVTGDVLSVQTSAQTIYFYDLTQLPALARLGRADLGGLPITDFDLYGDDLYLCRGFDGLWRYRLTNYSAPQFVDSSMLGIHYTKVIVKDSLLYALDDYNGILRYRLGDAGFGEFLDYLYVPFQVQSFLLYDSLVALQGDTAALVMAQFAAGGPVILDTIGLFSTPVRMYAQDTMIVTVNDDIDVIEVVSPHNGAVFQSYLQGHPALEKPAALFRRDGRNRIMFAGGSGGLLTYTLDDLWFNGDPDQGLARPGPITALTMLGGKLYTAGTNNPLDAYDLAADGRPTFDTTHFSGLTGASAMTTNGDTLFVQYTQLHRVLMFELVGDSLAYGGAIMTSSSPAVQLLYNPNYIDTLRSFFVAEEETVRLYTISDSGLVVPAGSVSPLGRIKRIAVVDSLLCVATNKGLWVYRIYNDFSVSYRAHIDLATEATHIMVFDGRLLTFNANDLVVIDLSQPALPTVDTTIALPYGVYGATLADNRMYTVGPYGMMVFDASGPLPEILEFGGRAGSLIAAHNGIVAISDGSSLHLYDLRTERTGLADRDPELPDQFVLDQNYPNPFNPTTTISFTLASRGRVDLTVFNALGQQVVRLVDDDLDAGSHQVIWDGNSEGGTQVASGVYFYRLRDAVHSESRKMVLLK